MAGRQQDAELGYSLAVGKRGENSMAQFFECFGCKKVVLLSDDTKKVCPGCGSANGQIIPFDRVKQGMDAGVFYNIDPRTGKPAKKKR